MASFLVWKAYGLGYYAHWRDGQITLGTEVEGIADPVAFLEFPGYMDHESIPGRARTTIAAIDASLPSSAVLLAALDDDSVTLMLDPPAFRLPSSPCVTDAAACILASRILMAIRDHLITPVTLSGRDLISEIDFASRLAATVGGETATDLALSASTDLELCTILPETESGHEKIMTEQENG
jgi:hypothetical protein